MGHRQVDPTKKGFDYRSIADVVDEPTDHSTVAHC